MSVFLFAFLPKHIWTQTFLCPALLESQITEECWRSSAPAPGRGACCGASKAESPQGDAHGGGSKLGAPSTTTPCRSCHSAHSELQCCQEHPQVASRKLGQALEQHLMGVPPLASGASCKAITTPILQPSIVFVFKLCFLKGVLVLLQDKPLLALESFMAVSDHSMQVGSSGVNPASFSWRRLQKALAGERFPLPKIMSGRDD